MTKRFVMQFSLKKLVLPQMVCLNSWFMNTEVIFNANVNFVLDVLSCVFLRIVYAIMFCVMESLNS